MSFIDRVFFFLIIGDDDLMQNHERGKRTPAYFTQYKNWKIWVCNSLLIQNIFVHNSAILIQSDFSALKRYVASLHSLDNEKPSKVVDVVCNEMLNHFNQMLKLKSKELIYFYKYI